MKHPNRCILIIIIMILTAVAAFGEIPPGNPGGMNVTATNSWTAAFAYAAGLPEVGQLAPSDMNHPPEYELKPSDVRVVRDADLLVYAGYEVLMKTVFDSFGKPEEELVQIQTSYKPEALRLAVMAISAKTGTEAAADAFAVGYTALIEESIDALKEKGLYGASTLVHFHQKPLAEALGFNILAVYGPAPVKAGELREYRNLSPELIIDNGHNPISAPIAEVTGAMVATLRNFPGGRDDEGRAVPTTLDGIVRFNVDRLLEVEL